MNARWVATAPDRWELRRLDGTKLGCILRLVDTNWRTRETHIWAPLPRGGNYLAARTRIRAAALDLEFHLGVFSSNVSPGIRHRAALLP